MKFSKNMIFAIIALGLLGTITSPALARPRNKKAKQEQERPRKRDSALPGVLMGAGTGGVIAGVAGSAKWAPLGIVGGAVAGYLLIRVIQKNKNERDSHTKPIKTNGRPHIKRIPQPDKKYEGKQ